MENIDKLKGKFVGMRHCSFLIAFLTLAIYMLDRAIGAIIYPSESSIITNLPQNDGSALYLIELDSVTGYATNSILFPILLLIFYRLAKGNKLPLLIAPVTLHYLSVIIVSAFFINVSMEETSEYLQRFPDYQSGAGERFNSDKRQHGVVWSKDVAFQLFNSDEGGHFIVKSGFDEEYDAPEENRVYVTMVDARLSLKKYVEYYYSPLMALFFVFLSILSFRYCYQLKWIGLFESKEDKKGEIKEHVESEKAK